MQLLYFPYLGLKDFDEIDFGEFKVWNFQAKADEYIKDEQTRKHIHKILQSNLSHNRPIDGICVFSVGNIDFREFTEEELSFADEVRLVLFLTFVAKTNVSVMGANAGHYMATSENFTYIIQSFEVGNNYISEQSGYIARKIVGGYKIGEIKFHAPSYLLTPLRFSIDGQLFSQLLKFRKTQKRLYRRILRATDLSFQSYFNDPYISVHSRVLLQIGAFEVLLDLPEQSPRKILKEKVKKYLVQKDDRMRTFFSERGANNKVKERASIKVMWADRFYALRNHIIHGNVVKPEKFYFYKQRHIEVFLMFFVLFIKEVINEKTKKTMFLDRIKWGEFEYDTEKFNGFVYEDNSLVLRLKRLKT